MGKQSTPLATAFFKMLIFGGLVGAVVGVILHIMSSLPSGFPGLLTALVNAILGFFAGLPVAATVAAPAIGLHNLASTRTPRVRLLAAALGALLGPLAAVGLATSGSPFNTLVPGIVWACFLPFAALSAIYFTRPLRRDSTVSTNVRESI